MYKEKDGHKAFWDKPKEVSVKEWQDNINSYFKLIDKWVIKNT